MAGIDQTAVQSPQNNILTSSLDATRRISVTPDQYLKAPWRALALRTQIQDPKLDVSSVWTIQVLLDY